MTILQFGTPHGDCCEVSEDPWKKKHSSVTSARECKSSFAGVTYRSSTIVRTSARVVILLHTHMQMAPPICTKQYTYQIANPRASAKYPLQIICRSEMEMLDLPSL